MVHPAFFRRAVAPLLSREFAGDAGMAAAGGAVTGLLMGTVVGMENIRLGYKHYEPAMPVAASAAGAGVGVALVTSAASPVAFLGLSACGLVAANAYLYKKKRDSEFV